MILVIGRIRESRQDLRRKVGMISREQVALDDIKIAFRTSLEKHTWIESKCVKIVQRLLESYF